ncbi:2,3-epoxybenzoyl-CoA dihydrolase [Zavarzinia sp. CC-PAN008]|uniref:2,3-epoxybenzoyl-CoA dihydrolase n=1 Tax=Zavarzinia sp. CC-PAN008 TaxID=3243332 RepID=UPI003F7434BC
MFTFDTSPERYRHWRLDVAGRIATLVLDVDEEGGLKPGYKLKLNSYDLGVDIELNDALNRIRFEHPQVACVVLTSGKARMFCSGANIYMLGTSSHAWKVNFCKFTNETRNGMEDSSRHSGLKFLAALNGATAGGGYEVALACDEIVMVDDRSTTVSLPEVPLLGVLPGTGGLTRLTDKRKVRRDLADVFCTTAEGVRADRARAWNLVDHTAPPARFAEVVQARAEALAEHSIRPAEATGVALPPLARTIHDGGLTYPHVDVAIDASGRLATLTVKGPAADEAADLQAIVARGADWWPLAMARELDDAILMLRLNHGDIGTLVLETEGDASAVLAQDAALHAHADHWFVRETVGLLRRTLARLDVSSRSLIALARPTSCFAGLLAELLFAADRSYMAQSLEGANAGATLALSPSSFGPFPMVNGLTRLANRFCERPEPVAQAQAAIGRTLGPEEALGLGLVTFAPDELDWEDEVRLALEERASLSPDALTAMEANLRFAGAETMETRIFGRLSAWQNWVFQRPNAVGDKGALKVYGSGAKAHFDWERV